MSNLLKKGMTVNKTERVIDYNEVIRNKLEGLMSIEKAANEDGFVSGLNASVVEELILDDNPADVLTEQSAASEVLLSDAQVQADEIINQAQSEADRINENAVAQAQEIADNAREQGYQDGMQRSQSEISAYIAKLDEEYNQRRLQLEQENKDIKAQIEPELVSAITDVFRKVTHTVAEDNQEIILHLINGVMRNADNSREFTIKVSPDDYKFLINNQGKIYCAMTREIQLDIVEDVTMKKNECIIETDTGVFNCSLDIELESLIKDLKLLSCV